MKQQLDCLTTLPPSIRIGTYDVAVAIEPFPVVDEDEVLGSFDDASHLITIAAELPDAMRAANVLMHEINHAIFSGLALRDGDDEERICTAIANGWTQVLRDNPALGRRILAALNSGGQ